jgi:hypothetical protein
MDMIVRAVAVGIGATLVMDAWAILLRRGFGVRPLDYAMVGRWLGHMRAGTFAHGRIAAAAAIPGERAIGWAAHYAIGVAFAALLLAACGGDWARQPTLGPALLTGILTMAAPWFVMQPGMGLGIAASKTPKPNIARLRSFGTHIVFGTGLYAVAWVLAQLEAL